MLRWAGENLLQLKPEEIGEQYGRYRLHVPEAERAMAKSLERYEALGPIFWGLAAHVLNQGRVAESLPWAQEMLDLAKATADGDLLIAGHRLACGCYCYAGELAKGLEHANKVLDLYDAEKHRHLADILNQDPKTAAGVFGSISTWMLGYPDRALRLSDEKDAHARRRGHPFDLGWALTFGVHEFDHRFRHDFPANDARQQFAGHILVPASRKLDIATAFRLPLLQQATVNRANHFD